jgi:polyhydroxyalkanoate synthesis regulator phasin
VSFEVFMVKFGQWGWYGAVALVGYIWNKQDSKIKDLETAHKEFITSEEAKKMVQEIIEPIRAEQKELKVDLKHVLAAVLEIQKEMAVQTALQKERTQSK